MKLKNSKKVKVESIVYTSLKLYHFIRLKIEDIKFEMKYGKQFKEYGLTLYCGRQGAGKSIAMTEYLYRMRNKYPNCKIYTNYGFMLQDGPVNSWHDFVDIRNGTEGVIFAIDEIQNEFDNNSWKTFPPWLLREITQQRKQRIKIVGTSQVYTRVVKQLREQCFEVVECRTLLGRWTFTKCFDAEDYNDVVDKPELKMKLRRKWRLSYIQTNKLRELFNSYDKVQALGEKAKNKEYDFSNDRVI